MELLLDTLSMDNILYDEPSLRYPVLLYRCSHCAVPFWFLCCFLQLTDAHFPLNIPLNILVFGIASAVHGGTL